MPNVPPSGGQKNYTARPEKVYGEQYLRGGPLPVGAVDAIEPLFPLAGGPYVNTSTGVYALRDTDWVLTNQRTGFPSEAIDDETFTERFGGAPTGGIVAE